MSNQAPLSSGKMFPLGRFVTPDAVSGNTTVTKTFSLDAEAATIWIHVNSIEALQLATVSIYAHIEKAVSAKKVLLTSFNTLTDADNGLMSFRQTGASTSLLSLEVTGSGAADIDVWVRGASAGESSVRILGNNAGSNYIGSATDSATVAVAASVTSRSGVLIHNNSENTVYWGFTALTATPATGMILPPNTPVGIDIAAGVEIYTSVDVGNPPSQLRIAEAGV